MVDTTVLVLHEGWGRTADMDSVIDRLDSMGFSAEAPDLFGSRPRLRAAVSATIGLFTGRSEAFETADRAFQRSRPAAVIGFSLGAAIALRRPWRVPTVVAYGHVPRSIVASRPILGIYGTADPLLRASGRRLEQYSAAEVRWYRGAGHSFLASGGVPSIGSVVGPHPAAAHAWEDLLEFLSRATAGDFDTARNE